MILDVTFINKLINYFENLKKLVNGKLVNVSIDQDRDGDLIINIMIIFIIKWNKFFKFIQKLKLKLKLKKL